jgi:hypothetical protein
VKNIPFYIISDKALTFGAEGGIENLKCVYSIIPVDFYWYFNVAELLVYIEKKNILLYWKKISRRKKASKAIKCREWPVLWRARKISFIPGPKHLYLSSHDLNTSRAEGRKEIFLSKFSPLLLPVLASHLLQAIIQAIK